MRQAAIPRRPFGGDTWGTAAAELASWPIYRWVAAVTGAVIVALVVGIPTGIVPSSLYHRMTPVTWWDYPVWASTALIGGLTIASYVRLRSREGVVPVSSGGRSTVATLASMFAVGCPICNKLVVGLIGVSGALSYWAPLQPILGVLSIALLLAGLMVRLRGAASCPVKAT
jgi:hypothetical protein